MTTARPPAALTEDELLREYGYVIVERRPDREPAWRRKSSGRIYTHSAALANVMDALDRARRAVGDELDGGLKRKRRGDTGELGVSGAG